MTWDKFRLELKQSQKLPRVRLLLNPVVTRSTSCCTLNHIRGPLYLLQVITSLIVAALTLIMCFVNHYIILKQFLDDKTHTEDETGVVLKSFSYLIVSKSWKDQNQQCVSLSLDVSSCLSKNFRKASFFINVPQNKCIPVVLHWIQGCCIGMHQALHSAGNAWKLRLLAIFHMWSVLQM